MMNVREILSDAGVSAVRTGVMVLRSLVIIAILTKLLGSSAQGIWTTLLAIVNFFMAFGELHLHGALVRYAPNDTQQILSDIFSLSLLTAIIPVGFLLVGGDFVLALFGEEAISGNFLVPLAVLTGVQIVSAVLINYPRAQQNVKQYELLLIGKALLESAVLAITLYTTKNLVMGLWGFTAAQLTVAAVLFVVYLPEFTTPNVGSFTKYIKYGAPMVPKELAATLLRHADKVLIIWFIGTSAAGVYSVGYAISSLLQRAPNIFNSTLYPNVTSTWENGEVNELSQFYSHFLRGYVIFILPAIAGLSFLAFEIMKIVSTPAIAAQGWPLIPILAIGFALQGIQGLLSYPLTAAEETAKIALTTVVAVILNVLLNILLIPEIGLQGAAIATTAAFSTRLIWIYYYTRQKIVIRFPLSTVGRALAATAIMLTGLLLLPIQSSLLLVVIAPPIGILLYGTSLCLTQEVTKEDITRAKILIRKEQ